MRILYIIPARAGSKGLPGKNTKILGDKPLISHTIEFVLKNIKENDELCISTDDDIIFSIAKDLGVEIPFKRPAELATDTATTYDVIIHALKFYEERGQFFDCVMLLQVTSPLRAKTDLDNVILSYDNDTDMVVTVKESKENPYFTLFEEDKNGLLVKSKISNFQRRQDCPNVFAFNGSMYLMNVLSLKKGSMNEFKRIKKVIMPNERSVDVDTMADWILLEYYFSNFNTN
ncbi:MULTISPECIES: cytidylyltransferase domain-containing protein [Flavobacterium]|uniref:Acylneuraminate cytidylyltransferase family protein n=1 Tax=Flavobacterium endoglycinae TaxID=2816357 RepID=A0ABX7Q9Z8_9FLAO|nr:MULTISPECIES: acylneuraminate cytidylyltransferase family protein [Flavobacterium]QSW87453.1 acylneuraminate cytidylyltransferase family protein [Flavobacterium endoglycinae]